MAAEDTGVSRKTIKQAHHHQFLSLNSTVQLIAAPAVQMGTMHEQNAYTEAGLINNDNERKDVSEEHKVNNYLDQSEGSNLIEQPPDRPPETEVRDGITDTDVIEQAPDRPPETEERDGITDTDVIHKPVDAGVISNASRKSTSDVSTKEKMVRELEKMKRADELREEWRVYEYKKLYRKNKEELERQKASKGIQLNSGVNESKQAIKKITDDEEIIAMKKQRRQFREESAIIRRQLEEKMGMLIRRENPDLKKMVDTFIYKPEDNSTIPEHILKVLSWSEIEDLKQSYNMFDVKGKGYINSKDVKRIVKMLGFRATKDVFDEMINELAGPNKDRVTFINFLDFIIKSQGDGPDPYDEILQAFKLMDTNDNGYLTISDLKTICESVNLNFSNKILREMVEEADNSGDGKISLEEFTSIMCQTARFKRSAPK